MSSRLCAGWIVNSSGSLKVTNMFEVMVCTEAKKLRIRTEGSSNSRAVDE